MLPPATRSSADYVYTQPGVELVGRRVGTGTAADLVLWQTDGAVRTPGAADDRRRADGATAPPSARAAGNRSG